MDQKSQHVTQTFPCQGQAWARSNCLLTVLNICGFWCFSQQESMTLTHEMPLVGTNRTKWAENLEHEKNTCLLRWKRKPTEHRTNFMRNMNMLNKNCQNTLRETSTMSNNQRLHMKVESNFNLTTTCSAQCTELVVLLLSDLIWLAW